MEAEPTQNAAQVGGPAAADFDRPLLLTPGQDLIGFAANRLGKALLVVIASSSIIAILLIFAFIIQKSIPFFSADSRLVEFFTSTHWYPTAAQPEFGGLNIIIGSVYVTAGATILAVLIGLPAAACLSDILPFSIRQVAKPIIEILAAIPSIAYGFFALLVFAPWLQRTFGLSYGTNALNASIILAIMAVPTIVSIAEDSLTAVGRELREGAYALGATRAEALLTVVFPAASSGLLAACILGTMRAVGETMVVWMATGNATQIPQPWWDLSQSVRTMTATIAGEMGETPSGSLHYHALFAIGAVLLAVTFLLNIGSEYIISRGRVKEPGRRRG